LKERFQGGIAHAFAPESSEVVVTHLSRLEPLRFLATPGLWGGLAFLVACLAVAIHLRRRSDPS